MVQVLVLRSHGTRMALPSWIEVVVDTGVGVVNDGGEDGEENTARSRLARRLGCGGQTATESDAAQVF